MLTSQRKYLSESFIVVLKGSVVMWQRLFYESHVQYRNVLATLIFIKCISQEIFYCYKGFSSGN